MKFDPESAQNLINRPAAATLADLEKTEPVEWLIWKHGFSVQTAVYLVQTGLSHELAKEYKKRHARFRQYRRAEIHEP